MMYKIVFEGNVIDIVKHPKFLRFYSNNRIALTDKTSAQGITGSDKTIYSLGPVSGQNYKVVTIVKIDQEEFDKLSLLLASGKTITADESELVKVKKAKINSLSNICKNKITAGFSIKLSDNNYHSFKLTVEDQLNLMMIENQMASGVETFIYHSTNQPCTIYSAGDMSHIIKAFRSFTLYHTTYFNAVKQYLNSLTDAKEIRLFEYGTDVSTFITDKVIQQILKSGGVVK